MVLPAVLLGCCNAFSYGVSNNKLHLWDANLRIHSLEPSRRQHFRIPSLDSVSSSALKASTEKTSIFSENYWKSRDIPNKLTLSRIFAIPLFVLTFLLRKVILDLKKLRTLVYTKYLYSLLNKLRLHLEGHNIVNFCIYLFDGLS